MAYTLTSGSLIEVTFKGTMDGQTLLSMFHYRLEGPTILDGRAFILDLLEQIDGAFGLKAQFLACISEAYLLQDITGQLIWAPPPAIPRRPRVVLTAGDNGSVEEQAFPSSVSVAITKRTDIAGRKGIGTLHMPGVPNTFVENSLVTSLGQSTYNILADVIDDNYVSGDNTLIPVIFQKALPIASPDITSANVEVQSRTMRRRVVGRGI